MARAVVYKQEFFDREYSAKEAYGRLWGFARKYRLRLVMGVFCGMLTAGTLVPMFGLIQPALQRVEAQQSAQEPWSPRTCRHTPLWQECRPK